MDYLVDLKNYLNITFEDEETDKKLLDILKNGIAYLDNAAGSEQNYSHNGIARQLLFDYSRYVYNDSFELFQQNYKSELIMFRIGVQVDDYAKEVSDI